MAMFRERPCLGICRKSSTVDWSQLPYDLLESIANQLHAIEDFLAFSAVCHLWRFVHLNKNWTPKTHIPWLVLNEYHNSDVPLRRIFSTCKFKEHKLLLPEAHGHQIWGSSHGWLVTVGQDLGLHLLNPITRVCIDLPTHCTLGIQAYANVDWFSFIRKATVFKIQDEFVTMAIYGHHYSLAFARQTDSAWTTVQVSTHVLFIDFVCFNSWILALSVVGTLFLVEIDGPDPPRILDIASPPKDEKGWQQIYLVESSGNLLMVFRYENIYLPKTVNFKVYQFHFSTGQWTILEDLGDRVLFVDDFYCTSVSACDDFRGNGIYFTKDNLDFLMRIEQNWDGQYIGLYHMNDDTTEIFRLGDVSPSCYTCPIWLVPTLS
ncbi:unnamed protein product [Ilex paraguariensis]|uniref:F-box protein n=1 Tax=Ilex paraguariensis TaxID=185542 RepID=A0ABC8USK2_9AQUA